MMQRRCNSCFLWCFLISIVVIWGKLRPGDLLPRAISFIYFRRHRVKSFTRRRCWWAVWDGLFYNRKLALMFCRQRRRSHVDAVGYTVMISGFVDEMIVLRCRWCQKVELQYRCCLLALSAELRPSRLNYYSYTEVASSPSVPRHCRWLRPLRLLNRGSFAFDISPGATDILMRCWRVACHSSPPLISRIVNMQKAKNILMADWMLY